MNTPLNTTSTAKILWRCKLSLVEKHFFENFDKHFNFLDQTEKDMERTTEEIRHKQTLMKHLTKDFDKIFTKKYQLEKKLLENLENQAANDTVKIILSITL